MRERMHLFLLFLTLLLYTGSHGVCFERCEMCSSENSCDKCEKGYFPYGDHCASCSVYCKNASCNQSTGSCLYGCADGISGTRCDERCSERCSLCNQFNSSKCEQCAFGLYGIDCNMTCSFYCKYEVDRQICHRNGSCIYGCKSKYWGQTCQNSCSHGCYNNICDAPTGVCSFGCIDNYIGDRCEYFFNKTEFCENDKQDITSDWVCPTKDVSANTAETGFWVVIVGSLTLLLGSAMFNIFLLKRLRFIKQKQSDNMATPDNPSTPQHHVNSDGQEFGETFAQVIETRSSNDITESHGENNYQDIETSFSNDTNGYQGVNDYQELSADRKETNTYSCIKHDYDN